jgi:hypothetical protein
MLLILSGPAGAGKTTVSRLLAESEPLSVHLRVDSVYEFLVSGSSSPRSEKLTPRTAPWCAPAPKRRSGDRLLAGRLPLCVFIPQLSLHSLCLLNQSRDF